MASLQTLAGSQRTEEEVRSKPRSIVIAHERSLGTLPIRSDDAKLLIREGLLYECPQHDLHLAVHMEWAHDDVERLIVAIARGTRSSIPVVNGHGPTIAELRERVNAVYEPPAIPVQHEGRGPPGWLIGAVLGAAVGVWIAVIIASAGVLG